MMGKVIGIDLGGTSIAGGVIDRDGKVYRETRGASCGHVGRDIVLERIREVIDELMDDDIEAIGLGTPGFVDVNEGKILSVSGNIKDWAYTNVRDELKKYYDLPIFIGNDANVAAICESWLGAGRDLDSFIMITLGTGVGGGIYSRESGIWYGHRYEGAEIGHTIMYPNGRKCSCGQHGCVEKYVSGNAIEQNYLDLTGRRIAGEEVFSRLGEDIDAKKAVDKFIDDLAILLITIKNTFDPEGVIIGGGVINSKEYWWNKVEETYRENCNSPGDLKILPAEHLNDAGMIGAARLAFLNL